MIDKKYVIVSPCRNEEKFMRRTLDTVVAQSIQPALWVIVDDGSTDNTPGILAARLEDVRLDKHTVVDESCLVDREPVTIPE